MTTARTGNRPTLIFDGGCPFCRKWVKRLQGMLHEVPIAFRSLTDESLLQDFPEVTRKELLSSIHFIAEDGTIHKGVEAIVEALSLRPAGKLSRTLKVPGIKQLSNAAYRLVASRRYRDEASREACADDNCATSTG